jgi:hypothetical protein
VTVAGSLLIALLPSSCRSNPLVLGSEACRPRYFAAPVERLGPRPGSLAAASKDSGGRGLNGSVSPPRPVWSSQGTPTARSLGNRRNERCRQPQTPMTQRSERLRHLNDTRIWSRRGGQTSAAVRPLPQYTRVVLQYEPAWFTAVTARNVAQGSEASPATAQSQQLG